MTRVIALTGSQGTMMERGPEYDTNFHEGHALGREHFGVGRFDQGLAHDNKSKPGYGAGYLAGYRLAKYEKERHAKKS